MKEKYTKEFAKFVLTDDKLKKLLGRKTFLEFLKVKNSHEDLKFSLAQKIAEAIKKWAASLGATHYTHWFFPLTGKSAEKQVSFLDLNEKGKSVLKFNGNCLIKGETDASSFPSGGERLTFEARGYTVWDYSSPVFIKEDEASNRVLYIPTAFCSFTGVALDEKTPLLRAEDALSDHATEVLNKLGYRDVKNVYACVGSEQEYFLVKKDLFEKRKDLVLSGRTLLGENAIKKQEMYHHYFGQINSDISAFMHDVDKELWAVGIMAKIQHNEVAPSQHEVVPVFCRANVAVDQNFLLLEIMNKVAAKHGYSVLIHEKPFKGVNGSGKHNNWSLSTNTGLNLLDPNAVSEDVFMLFFTSVIAAIDKHYPLLRLSVCSHANDLRLGGDEAPVSIVSIFVGQDMQNKLDGYGKEKGKKTEKSVLDIKTTSVAKPDKDNCDRNRTSPFAFTGNKFEFRMPGSSSSAAFCNCVLSTIVASELSEVSKRLECGESVKDIVLSNIKNHSRIIFNGNSYDEKWAQEAKKRGLKNFKDCADCFKLFLSDETQKLFEEQNVMSKAELNVRFDTAVKTYVQTISTEAKTLVYMLTKQVLPNLKKLQENIIGRIKAFEEAKINKALEEEDLKTLSQATSTLQKLCGQLEELLLKGKTFGLEEKCEFYHNDIIGKMEEIRAVYDSIEPKVPIEFMPFPCYDDLLF